MPQVSSLNAHISDAKQSLNATSLQSEYLSHVETGVTDTSNVYTYIYSQRASLDTPASSCKSSLYDNGVQPSCMRRPAASLSRIVASCARGRKHRRAREADGASEQKRGRLHTGSRVSRLTAKAALSSILSFRHTQAELIIAEQCKRAAHGAGVTQNEVVCAPQTPLIINII